MEELEGWENLLEVELLELVALPNELDKLAQNVEYHSNRFSGLEVEHLLKEMVEDVGEEAGLLGAVLGELPDYEVEGPQNILLVGFLI